MIQHNRVPLSPFSGSMDTQEISLSNTDKLINSEQVVNIINYMQGNKTALRNNLYFISQDLTSKKMIDESQIRTEEEILLFNDVNKVCSSRMSESKRETNIVDDDKVGQKRPNKEELSRGHVSSGSEVDSDLEDSK